MMEDNKGNINKTKDVDANQLNFLKIDKLKRGSHALSLMLRNEDIIVGLNGKTFRGTQKIGRSYKNCKIIKLQKTNNQSSNPK